MSVEGIPQSVPRFDPEAFVNAIARVSRDDDKMPDPEKGVGRECYAFTEQEDAALSEVEKAAREIFQGLEEGKDFEIRHDAIGNTFVTLKAYGSNLPPVWVGSHVDSVANGGKFDGVAGVAIGLEMLSTLAQGDIKAKRDFTVAVFRSEESSPKNSYGCLGSAVATGLITPESLNGIKYEAGTGVLLKDHFTERYGAGRWADVETSLGRSPINKDTVGAYLELHIEQSGVASANDKDIGIVVEGIGGARREKTAVTLKPETFETKDDECDEVTLTFEGEPNHTGGTPPNRNFYNVPGVVWYRKDALVASSNVVNKLLQDSAIKLLSSQPPKPTGFTSIPARQIVKLLVPKSRIAEFSTRLSELSKESTEKLGVKVSAALQPFTGESASIVDSSRVRQLMNVPQIVSVLATKAFQKQGTETGTTRATIVDYNLTPDSIAYNLDLREVNEAHLKELMELVHKRQELTLGEGSFTLISAKVHSPVDPELVQRLQAHARELGISFVLMPSGAGHDADRIAAKGVPVGMVFVRQKDGVSHSPYERMDWNDYKKASAVMRAAIVKLLKEE